MTPPRNLLHCVSQISTPPQGEGINFEAHLSAFDLLPIDVEAVHTATLNREPFPWLMVPGFVRSEAIPAIERDFPAVAHAGSFPLPTLHYGPAFQAFIDAIRGPEFTQAVAEK